MKKLAFLFFVSLCFAVPTFSQTSRGTVSGTITDPNGAVIAGATVTLTNVETNIQRTSTSNDAGLYRFEAVELGTYTVAIEASGFGRNVNNNLVVNANLTSTVDVQLQLGSQDTVVDVTADSGAVLQVEAPVRGGNISTRQITELPIANRNPVLLALTLPGVTSNRGGFGVGTFVVNGARGRSNNFLIDGTENNDISVGGQAFQITNPDAVQEVSIQTANYDSEFGRAGGAVVNTIVNSGRNDVFGTLSFQYDSSADDAITSAQSRNPEVLQRGRPLSNTQIIPAGTLGGPIYFPRFGEGGRRLYNGRDRNFFFVAYQENRFRQPGGTLSLTTPTAAGRGRLRELFPQGTNANVDNYLAITQDAVGIPTSNNPAITQALGAGRGDIEFATFIRNFTNLSTTKEFISRTDHRLTENDQLTLRFLSQQSGNPLGGFIGFEGFDVASASRYYNFLVSETHVFSPTLTNELRVAYNRILLDFPLDTSNPFSTSLSRTTITNLSGFGVDTAFPQGRVANNYVLQDTVTKVFGNHTFRGGIDFLRQIARQSAPFNSRGSLAFAASGEFSAFANFVDNFGGVGGSVSRDFGSPLYFPTLYRTAAFFQDRWRATSAVTLTLGLRYENFGTPFNSLRTPAFTGAFNVDPVTRQGPFSEANSIEADNNNFAPTLGINISPSYTDGILGRLVGDKRTVLRAGYQIGYESFFNNIASNAAASSPNTVNFLANSVATSASPRGLANFSNLFPTTAPALSPLSAQSLLTPNFVNPYYQRYSAGIQRELPYNTVIDVSYVGSRGIKLFINEDANPLVRPELRITPANYTGPTSGRLDNLQGARTVRTNGGASTYHSGQLEVRRRFANNFQVTGSYTFSKYLSNADEVFVAGVASGTSFFQTPAIFGGDRLDRAVSVYDRPHRAVFSYVVESPFFREQRGIIGHLLGGYQVAGITTLESGVPYTIFNGLDADGIGGAGADRPNFNPNGQRGVAAVPEVGPQFITVSGQRVNNPDFGRILRYYNPDIAGRPTIDPNTARFIVNPAYIPGNPFESGIPRVGTLGRNTERSPGLNNTNLVLSKRTQISEGVFFQARAELFNAFNHPQFPSSGTISSNAFTTLPGRFLNPDTPATSGGGREVRYLLRLVF